jgi:ubiquinone/menaquinone biosynthesis C-methylase UbiE
MRDLPGPVLDLGSGTGIWSLLLAEWFNVEVVGIEPSSGMRGEAIRKRSHPRVRYIAGEAEHLPLKDGACAAVWISTVVHHVPDLQAGAREVRRILQPGGPVLIRSPFSGRHQGILWTYFFPSALQIAERRHPSVEATVKAFSVAGFDKKSLQGVSEITASNLKEYADRIETRADSSLKLISDEEFGRGLGELRKSAENESSTPVTTVLDLLVLR